MIISLIVAASENNAIGKNNDLLWSLPNDMKFFKNTTWGMPVIMGRRTYDSFNNNLSGRFNIVITTQKDWSADGVIVASSIDDAIVKAKETNCKEIFVIGGGQVYKQSMEIANRIYMTRVKAIIEDADTFFPAIDETKWTMISHEDHTKDEKHAYDYSFQIWETAPPNLP
jgi:dihydrofolate reductase